MSDFDRIAQLYSLAEFVLYGDGLQLSRIHFLDKFINAKKVIFLGEGDGRSLAYFLEKNRNSTIDYVDTSVAMLKIAKMNCRNSPRVNFYHENLLNYLAEQPSSEVDLVVCPFILDTFNDAQISMIESEIHRILQPKGSWLITDYQTKNIYHSIHISLLYKFFSWVSGLRVQSLPDWNRLNLAKNFLVSAHKEFIGGLIFSKTFVKKM